jgi:hypothetical protein
MANRKFERKIRCEKFHEKMPSCLCHFYFFRTLEEYNSYQSYGGGGGQQDYGSSNYGGGGDDGKKAAHFVNIDFRISNKSFIITRSRLPRKWQQLSWRQ